MAYTLGRKAMGVGMIEIKSVCCGEVICEGRSIHLAIWQAVKDGVSLRYANLSHLDLNGIHIPDVDLSYANLMGTNFKNANLTGGNLTGAEVRDTIFNGANLSNVDYTDCDLFGGAHLRRTDLRGIHSEVSPGRGFWGNFAREQMALSRVDETQVEQTQMYQMALSMVERSRVEQTQVEQTQVNETASRESWASVVVDSLSDQGVVGAGVASNYTYCPATTEIVYTILFHGSVLYKGPDSVARDRALAEAELLAFYREGRPEGV